MFGYQEFLSGQGPVSKVLFLILLLWTVFWKGLALWRSSRNTQKYWFVAILILNTAGILPIVYLAFFKKKIKKSKK
jgi:hypothetical protein